MTPRRRHPLITPARCCGALLVLGLAWQPQLRADEDQAWALCRHQPARALPDDLEAEAGHTVIGADTAQSLSKEIMVLTGNVRVYRDQQLLTADQARYNKGSGRIDASGDIEYIKAGLAIRGDSAEMDSEAYTGTLTNASFELSDRHARGDAESADIVSEHVTELHRVRYTTCDPGNDDWYLRSNKVVLDQAREVGSAQHMILSFKKVPFFYFPYVTFPIGDARKSGFLVPNYRDSSVNGTEITIPYYLNLAPRYDATVTARSLSHRGNMLGTEFRYLNPRSYGVINSEYLPDDSRYMADRYSLDYLHQGNPTHRWSTRLAISRVSDSDYFAELGNSLSTASLAHLSQTAEATYRAPAWSLNTRLQSYQTIDDTIPDSARPYKLLPQIRFATEIPERDRHLNYRLEGEYTDFQRDNRMSGSRLTLQPALYFPLSNLAGYIKPGVKLHYRTYALQDATGGIDPDGAYAVPSATLDGGVFLDRDHHWGEKRFLHTLEPRFFYLYSAYRDQNDAPSFDASLPDFSFAQLFRDNRFTGGDRYADANQVSLSLTTRLIEEDSGKQRLQAAIGQIYYLDDRRVALGGGAVDTSGTSDTVAETTVLLTDSLTAKADVRWDEAVHKSNKGSLQLQYHPGYRRVINMAYRYRKNSLEQSDVSLLWPLHRRFYLIGRSNYSLLDDRNLESLAGIEYQSCCWRVQVVRRRYLITTAEQTNDTLYVQFELKGLTSLGDRIESLLERGILGYQQ